MSSINDYNVMPLFHQENPQSLHSLGLAVHANFVPLPDKDSVSKANLPWLTEQNVFEGNFDITVS